MDETDKADSIKDSPVQNENNRVNVYKPNLRLVENNSLNSSKASSKDFDFKGLKIQPSTSRGHHFLAYKAKNVQDNDLYKELVKLDDANFVENKELFRCEICLCDCEPYNGIILSECIHSFCKECIKSFVEISTDTEIKCPFRDDTYSCDKIIQHREIKEIVGDEQFEKFLERSLSFATNTVGDMKQCLTPDCKEIFIVDEDPSWYCMTCGRVNCILCEGQHDDRYVSCEKFKSSLKPEYISSETLVNRMVYHTGEAMLCPNCGIVIQKISGCDGLQCTKCMTPICWATRGPRWGPGGKGDTTGGCRCDSGRRCHPNCRNCH